MTTPRDDIAGLSERLRSKSTDCHVSEEAFYLEAATQLDSLLKERDALQARVKELEAHTSDFGSIVSTLESRAARLQQERDEASRMNHIETEKLEDRIEALQLRFDNLTRLVGGIVADLRCSADSAAVFEAIAELRQERDEAYERAAKVAEEQAVEFLSPQYASEQPFGSICERFACEEVAKAIRRLAGPEKEKTSASD